MKKSTLILIASALVISLALWGYLNFTKPKDAAQFHIMVEGKEFGTYSFDEDQTIRIDDLNTCLVQDHKVSMIVATCPDHLCMLQRPIDANGGMIVCLPNRVVIEAVGNQSVEPTYDDSEDADASSVVVDSTT
ncbi:MAG: NusG domain II-containing protein [Eubacteriales bacterium]|nr:NusG domain II-containing protein [Eubacteriales bacterium]